MTWKDWFSDDSAWAIIRRGIVATGIGLIAAIFLELHLGAHNFWSHDFWFPCVAIPIGLTILKLLDRLGTRGNERDEKRK